MEEKSKDGDQSERKNKHQGGKIKENMRIMRGGGKQQYLDKGP